MHNIFQIIYSIWTVQPFSDRGVICVFSYVDPQKQTSVEVDMECCVHYKLFLCAEGQVVLGTPLCQELDFLPVGQLLIIAWLGLG